MQKNNYKDIFLIVSSFLIGGIVMLALIIFTPLVREIMKTNYGINNTANHRKGVANAL